MLRRRQVSFMRPADRMALCELRADDAEALEFEFVREARVTV